MKKNSPYCTHDELVQLCQEGVIGEVDIIMMDPDEELKDEFKSFCEAHEMEMNDLAARDFLTMMEEALAQGMECGDA